MAERELGFQVNFSHCAFEIGQIEEGVVAEAASSPGGLQDCSSDEPFGGLDGLAVACRYEDATVLGCALCFLHSSHALKEDHVIPYVCVVDGGIGRIENASVGCEASGPNARGTREGIDFETGVVGEDQLIGRDPGVVDSLECCIGEESGAILFGGGNGGEIWESLDGDIVSLSGGAEIAELALACGGNKQAESHAESVIGKGKGSKRENRSLASISG